MAGRKRPKSTATSSARRSNLQSLPPSTVPEAVSLADAQDMALKITTYFEGGKSMNYAALAGDFDGQGTSFGLIQWNFGSGTLGPLLKTMLEADQNAFSACFAEGAGYETLKTALVAGNQAEQIKWARDCIQTNRAAWADAFNKIGSDASFQEIQKEQAAAHYQPMVVSVLNDLRALSRSFFAKIEFRTYAALFDLCVQQGSLHEANGGSKAIEQMKLRIANEKPSSQLEVMKIVVQERGLTAATRWRNDCISRRMGILTGASYKATEGGEPVERTNPQFSLIRQFGATTIQDL